MNKAYKTCVCCDKPFTPIHRGAKRIYCNELCRAKASRLRKKALEQRVQQAENTLAYHGLS